MIKVLIGLTLLISLYTNAESKLDINYSEVPLGVEFISYENGEVSRILCSSPTYSSEYYIKPYSLVKIDKFININPNNGEKHVTYNVFSDTDEGMFGGIESGREFCESIEVYLN